MAEKISVLLAVAVDADPALIDFTRQSIEAQTYPQALIDFVKIEYVSTAPGARVSALNAAREAATGTYVVAADLGEVWDGHKLERQVAHLYRLKDALCCVHQMAGGQDAFNLQAVRTYGAPIGSLLGKPWGTGALLVSRAVMDAVGAYRSVEESTWEYGVRLINRGHQPLVIEEDLSVWQGESLKMLRPLVADGIRHRFLTPYLEKMDLFDGLSVVSESDVRLVRGALYQKNDDLETAHTICQEIDRENRQPASSYWHGIIHRREPDFNNARSWFDRTEGLRANDALYRAASTLLQQVIQQPDYGVAREVALTFLRHLQMRGTWDPLYVVDLCERVVQEDDQNLRQLLEELQEVEYDTLFDWTFRRAVGEAI